ncbi:MAG: aminoacylase [Candidatus Tectimicrobiota bacterium]|nr:MAG: aminoacylase [Candidatus Tectomicrobia bacterium]
MTFDLLIRHGTIVDGTGAPGFRADLGVRGDRIAAIAPTLDAPARRTLDAGGLVVAPGFIDAHTHSDFTLLSVPGADSKVRQGITTEVVGNCGFSPAPVAPQTLALLKEYVGFLNPDLPWNWQRLGEFYAQVEARGCAINVVPLVGHGAVRIAVMGFANRPPDADELRRMQQLVAEAMADGAFGLSSGLIYTPGCYADTAELIALAQVVRGGGLYATHMRGEGGTLLEALAEALRIGEEAGVPVQVSHLKAAGRENWGKMAPALRMLEEASARGLAVTADIYPYTAGSTTMTSLFPAWSLEGGLARFLARLRDAATRRRIVEEMQGGEGGWTRANGSLRWEDIVIASCRHQKAFEGQSVAQLAAALGQEPAEAMMDFLLAEEGKVSVVLFMMSEDNVARGLVHPLLMIGSDSLALTAGRGGKPHPRTYGTFPRVLGKYVRQERLLSLEAAVHKMTAMAAAKFGLADRGVLAEGKAADITVFDAATVGDQATYAQPHQYPTGIAYVIVNGELVVEQGTQHPVLPGRVLRKA